MTIAIGIQTPTLAWAVKKLILLPQTWLQGTLAKYAHAFFKGQTVTLSKVQKALVTLFFIDSAGTIFFEIFAGPIESIDEMIKKFEASHSESHLFIDKITHAVDTLGPFIELMTPQIWAWSAFSHWPSLIFLQTAPTVSPMAHLLIRDGYDDRLL